METVNIALVVWASVASMWAAVFAILFVVADKESKRLAEESMHDSLTKLLNRRGFSLQANRVIRRLMYPVKHHDTSEAFTVVAFDLDGFKKLNDTKGHQQGDAALRAFAEALINTFRPSDVVARTGGDEFIALFPNLSDRQVEGIIKKRLIRKIEDDLYKAFGISVSVGIASPSGTLIGLEPEEMITEIIGRADEALYESKDRSREGNIFPVTVYKKT